MPCANVVIADLLGRQVDASFSVARARARTRDPVVGRNLAPSPCSRAAETGVVLDTRNNTDIQHFDGTDVNWEEVGDIRPKLMHTWLGLVRSEISLRRTGGCAPCLLLNEQIGVLVEGEERLCHCPGSHDV